MQRTLFPRIYILFLAVFFLTGLILVRLFYLQVIAHSYYIEIARTEQMGYTKLPARRGEVLIEDYHSGEAYKLATNTTLNMIYADPTLIEDPALVASTLAPLLFDLEIEKELDEKAHEEEYKIIMEIEDETLRNEALSKLDYKTDEELFQNYQDNLEETLATKVRDVILITEKVDAGTQVEIKNLNLPGIEVGETGNIYAYPAQINNKASVANALARVFGSDASELERILLGKNRFVILKRRLEPEISAQIEAILAEDRKDPPGIDNEPPLHFLGIRLKEEYFRFYPEQELAAQILGYVDSAGNGQYGVEGTFNEILKGKDGVFTSQTDAHGNQITVGDAIIEQAEDGADVTLTLDRAIQLQVERLLAEGVREYRPDSGQAIVMDPRTGAVLAMAQYPSFNPNFYGEVFETEPITFTEEEKERIVVKGTEENPIYWFYKQINPDLRFPIFPNPENPDQYTKYVNETGPEVYKNKFLQETYEPGSVFKPLVMAAAINAGEVEPNSTFMDSGPIPVDYNNITKQYEYEINTFNNQYFGVMSMTQVLEKSSNTGMTYIVRKLGKNLFYSYLEDFGFTKRTGIGIDDEVKGILSHYNTWRAESEMITKAFGQGISVTPIQMAQAYTALGNNGVMMRPMLVKKITYPDGRTEEFEPEIVRQVLTEQTTAKVTAMLTSTAESYVTLALNNHYFAGKTGTAQTYKNGRALSGAGTTKTTFIGYGPIEEAQFLVIVKMDYPRSSEWAESTSGRVGSKILAFLYDYYNVPPDKNL